jgi:hypothetical protein
VNSRAILFPDPPRDFPGRRLLKIGLRGVHVLCASLCVGAYAFDSPDRAPWLVATIGTGLLLLALDLHQSAAFLLEVRGAFVVAKVVALAFVPAGGAWLLGAIVLLSVVSSHAPGEVRHRLLFSRGRIRVAETHG